MRIIPLLLTVSLLAACTPVGEKLALLKQQSPAGDSFNVQLAREYKQYAESLAERGHPVRADRYAAKALAALNGEPVAPDEVASLANERAALLQVLTDEVKEVAPDQTARAQILFDCWANELGRFDSAETLCKESFGVALTDVQFIADTLVHGDGNQFAVHFAAGSASLSAQADQVISVIAGRTKGMGQYKVELVAYGKRPHAKPSVKALAAKRELAIEKALIAHGVNAGRIHGHAAGSGQEVFLDTRQAGESADAVGITLQTFGQPEGERTP